MKVVTIIMYIFSFIGGITVAVLLAGGIGEIIRSIRYNMNSRCSNCGTKHGMRDNYCKVCGSYLKDQPKRRRRPIDVNN